MVEHSTADSRLIAAVALALAPRRAAADPQADADALGRGSGRLVFPDA